MGGCRIAPWVYQLRLHYLAVRTDVGSAIKRLLANASNENGHSRLLALFHNQFVLS